MHRDEKPALRGSWLGTLLRAWNPFMRPLLASPLHWPLSRWFMLLSWTGTKTGENRTTPVSYVAEGRHVYVTTGDRWWRNAVRAGTVSIRLKGREYTGRLAAVEDAQESIQQHARLFRERAFFRRLAGIPEISLGEPDIDAIRRSVSAGRTLLRIELAA